jgi:membrane-bound inhibitor of C-type lysozyme
MPIVRLLLAGLGLLAAAACAPAPAQPTPPPAAPVQAAPVNPDPQVRTYLCANGEQVRAGYPTPDTAVVERAGRPYPLNAAPSASGVRYTGFGLQWWTKGAEAYLSQLKLGESSPSEPPVVCRVAD